MTLVPGRPKDVANFFLLLLVLAVLFFHQLVGDPLKRYAHALVFGILLTCRLLIARKPEDRSSEKKALPKSYVRALPLLKKMGINSILLRKSIGALEVACGIVMILGLFFVFMGTITLTPRLSKDAYSEMKRAYKSYVRATILV